MECKRYEQREYLRKVFGAAFYKKVPSGTPNLLVVLSRVSIEI